MPSPFRHPNAVATAQADLLSKDKYFDNDQLIDQTKIAMEVFDAMNRHVAPARDVVLPPVRAVVRCVKPVEAHLQFDGMRVHLQLEVGRRPVRLQLNVQPPEVKHLPRVRCQALLLFDHSSGHAAGATDSRSVTAMPKGPDWNGKLPWMRDGWYLDSRGPSWPRISYRMQFSEGDVLPVDLTVPVGINPNGSVGPDAVVSPQIIPEQLITVPRRSVLYTLGGLGYMGEIIEVNGEHLLVEFEDDNVGDSLGSERDDGAIEMTLADVLASLVGPPPDPNVQQEAPPTSEEEVDGCTLWFKKSKKVALFKLITFHTSSTQLSPTPPHPTELNLAFFTRPPPSRYCACYLQATLKKKKPTADADEWWKDAQTEWSTLALERRMLWVRKVRTEAAGSSGPGALPRMAFKQGDLVPRALWGRHKGMEVLLAERGLLPPGSLRVVCESAKHHAADNSCCCKRLLASQSDFTSEVSALDRVVSSGGHRCLFLPKYHCELNWIERYWGAAKKYARRHCGYTLIALRACVPIALSQTLAELPQELRTSPHLPVSPLFKQRRWARISWRYAAEYRKGESGNAVVRAVASMCSKRHRDTSDPRARQAEAAMEAAAFALC